MYDERKCLHSKIYATLLNPQKHRRIVWPLFSGSEFWNLESPFRFLFFFVLIFKSYFLPSSCWRKMIDLGWGKFLLFQSRSFMFPSNNHWQLIEKNFKFPFTFETYYLKAFLASSPILFYFIFIEQNMYLRKRVRG